MLFTCTEHEVKVIRKRVSVLLTLKEQVEGITEVLEETTESELNSLVH